LGSDAAEAVGSAELVGPAAAEAALALPGALGVLVAGVCASASCVAPWASSAPATTATTVFE
jgi:hypothetical protein